MTGLPAPRRPADDLLLADQQDATGHIDAGVALRAMLAVADGQMAARAWDRVPAALTARVFLAVHDLNRLVAGLP